MKATNTTARFMGFSADLAAEIPANGFSANVPLMLDFVSRSVIHRLNFPKREAGGTGDSDLAKLSPKARAGKLSRMASASRGEKSRPMLSPEDCAEVKQAVALALVASRAFETATLRPIAWLSCFRAARATLGMDRRWRRTGGDDSAILGSLLAPLGDPEADARRRMTLARRAAFLRSCLHAAFTADPSRKRRAAYRGHLATLRQVLTGTLRHRGMTEAEISATGMRVLRMKDYAQKGEALLSAQAEAEAATRQAPAASKWQPLEAFTASRVKLPAKHRPRLAEALGFNP